MGPTAGDSSMSKTDRIRFPKTVDHTWEPCGMEIFYPCGGTFVYMFFFIRKKNIYIYKQEFLSTPLDFCVCLHFNFYFSLYFYLRLLKKCRQVRKLTSVLRGFQPISVLKISRFGFALILIYLGFAALNLDCWICWNSQCFWVLFFVLIMGFLPL